MKPIFSLIELGPGNEYFLLNEDGKSVLIAPVIKHHLSGKRVMTCSWWTTIEEEVNRVKSIIKQLKK